jgi:hypothetical protein
MSQINEYINNFLSELRDSFQILVGVIITMWVIGSITLFITGTANNTATNIETQTGNSIAIYALPVGLFVLAILSYLMMKYLFRLPNERG